MISTLNYYDYIVEPLDADAIPHPHFDDDNNNEKIKSFMNVSSQEIQDLKYFLFLTTHNQYTDTEIEYIIKNRLLEYD